MPEQVPATPCLGDLRPSYARRQRRPQATPPATSAIPDLLSLNLPSLRLLYHLGPMSLSDIAQKILTTGGNLTMVVGNLEKLGLAHRQKCPEDRRLLIVVLTSKGKALIRKIFPEHAAAIAEFMGALSPAEQEQLADLCRQLGAQDPSVVLTCRAVMPTARPQGRTTLAIRSPL